MIYKRCATVHFEKFLIHPQLMLGEGKLTLKENRFHGFGTCQNRGLLLRCFLQIARNCFACELTSYFLPFT